MSGVNAIAPLRLDDAHQSWQVETYELKWSIGLGWNSVTYKCGVAQAFAAIRRLHENGRDGLRITGASRSDALQGIIQDHPTVIGVGQVLSLLASR